MASASGQHFLDLLFGGLNEGLDQFHGGQQRGQDLALNLHQMRAQQANADRAHNLQLDDKAENIRRYEAGVARDSALNFERKNDKFVDQARQSFMDKFKRAEFADTHALNVARLGEVRARQNAKAEFDDYLTNNKDLTDQQRLFLRMQNSGQQVPSQLMSKAFSTGQESADALINSMFKSRFDTGIPVTPQEMDEMFATAEGIKSRFADKSPLGTPGEAIAGPSADTPVDKLYSTMTKPGLLPSSKEAIALIEDPTLWEPDESDTDKLRYLLGEGKIKQNLFGSIMKALKVHRASGVPYEDFVASIFTSEKPFVNNAPRPDLRTRNANPNPIGIPTEF